MDDLDRMFRRLVSVIRADFPSYLDQPFEVAELYQSIIPYRHHRRELGFETNQDYELTLLRLLAGARGYVNGDPRMQERLRQELSGSNPDSSVFRGFATTTVTLDPEAVRWIESPEAERGERRPGSDRGASRFADEHLVDDRGRQRGLDDSPEADAKTVVFRRGSPAANTAQAAAPQAAQAAQATTAQAAASPPPPAPAAGGATAPMSGASAPVSVTSTGPTPSTSFIRSAPADAPRPVPNAGQGDGGARASQQGGPAGAAAMTPPTRPPAAPPPRPTAPSAGAAGAAAASSAAGATRAPAPSPSTRQAMPTPQRGAQTIVASGNCHYCGGELPDGRRITFCPHCGQNLTIQHCPACSTELELGWKFCTTCGREVAQQ